MLQSIDNDIFTVKSTFLTALYCITVRCKICSIFKFKGLSIDRTKVVYSTALAIFAYLNLHMAATGVTATVAYSGNGRSDKCI